MQRDARAYLADILESCDAIDSAIAGMGLSDYLGYRLVRSSVEREFTIIGEAVLAQIPRELRRDHGDASHHRLPQSPHT